MRLLLVIVITFLLTPLWANTQIETQIHDIDMGQANEEPLIFFSTGQVVSFPTGDKKSFSLLREAIQNKSWFRIIINDEREIIRMTKISPPIASIPLEKNLLSTEPFKPSILMSMDQARAFFYEARNNARQESQCYNRAHVWSYEWRIKNNLYSSKAWLFFTRKFIRKYKFEWWFHVAPMIHVVTDGQVKERIMDIKYAKGPLKLKNWTDIFLRDNADCPVVEKYSDQANFPESGSCFVMKSSMYYYQPVDLEKKEMIGEEKSRWHRPEVEHAYLDAFEHGL